MGRSRQSRSNGARPDTGGAVSWSPDGRHVATEGPEGSKSFDVRDADTGQIVRSLKAPEDVTGLEYSPDGTVLATTDRGGTTRLWNSTTGKRLASIEGPNSLARSPKFSPDGSMLAIVWPDQSLLRIVDVETGEIVVDSRAVTGATRWTGRPTEHVLRWRRRPSRSERCSTWRRARCCRSSRGTSECCTTSNGARTAAPSPRPAALALPTSSLPAPAYSRWSYLATAGSSTPWLGNRIRRAWPRGSNDGAVKVWGVLEGGGRELMTLTGDDVRSGVADIEFSPDGNKLISSGLSGVTSVWDVGLSAGSEVATLPAAGIFPSTAEFSPDGQHLFTTSSGGRVAMWDTDTWEQVRILGEPGPTPDPSFLSEVPLGSQIDVVRIAPSPDGELVAAVSDASATGASPGRVRVLDTESGTTVLDLNVGSLASDVDWSPDGDVLAISGKDGDGAFVRLVDRSGSTIEELPFGDVLVTVAGFALDGDASIVSIEPPRGRYLPDVGRVEVWDWRDTTLTQTIDADPFIAVPSPVDDLVAIGPNDVSPDQSMSIWNIRTGERVTTLGGHTGSPNHLAYTADGTRLAVANSDGTTRIWDPTTGELLLTLGGHLGLVSSVSFNPDGTRLATASVDGRVRVWALDTDSLVEIAEQRVTRTLTDAECLRYLDESRCET